MIWLVALIDKNKDEIIVIKLERMGFGGVFTLLNSCSAIVFTVTYTVGLTILVYVSYLSKKVKVKVRAM